MRARRLAAFIAVASMLAICSMAAAWTSIGPWGGEVDCIAIDPVSGTTLYAAGLGGVYKSTDSGGRWSRTGDLSLVSALAVDPETPSAVYAADHSTLFKSEDGGAHWKKLPFRGRQIRSIAVDRGHQLYLGTSGELVRSGDDGKSWTTIPGVSSGVEAIAIDPVRGAIVCIVSSKVIRSRDGGKTWDRVKERGPFGRESLVVVPSNTTLYSVADSELQKSVDDGSTFTTIAKPRDHDGFTDITIDPHHPDTLYVGHVFDGVSRSSDGGKTWISINEGLSLLPTNALAVDVVHPSTIFAGGIGVFETNDGGGTWKDDDLLKSVTSIALSAKVVVAGTQAFGITRSDDGGRTWKDTDLVHGVIRAIVIGPAKTVIAVANRGVFRSTDAGATWKENNGGLGTARTQASRVTYSRDGEAAYAATTAGLYRSAGNDSSWTHVDALGSDSVLEVAASPTGSVLYATKISQILFTSKDGGRTWRGLAGAPYSIERIAVDPGRPSNLYAATYDGDVFVSHDDGQHWKELEKLNVEKFSVTSLIVANKKLYASTAFNGVYVRPLD